MSNQFLEIIENCRRPTIAVMKKALAERPCLSTAESNFITYLAGFSHNEFCDTLFDEFGLSFVGDTSILFDRLNNKFHIKILLNDISVDLQSLYMEEISQTYQLPISTHTILSRNRDGSFADNFNKGLKKLNRSQLAEYISQHILGLSEDVISYTFSKKNVNLIIHITTVSQRNILANLNILFRGVSAALIANFPNDLPNVSLKNLQSAEEIYPLMSKVKWYVIDRDSPEEVTSFLEKIGAEYRLIPYLGDEYDYLSYLLSEIEAFMMKHCQDVV
ncbi:MULTISPECIES: hypothetical protein [Aerosakkonema]|uniref:hypothetical protein n=1 Tax=Aerosakkonema TaxID=1246629 RepID=UPI0035B9D4C4